MADLPVYSGIANDGLSFIVLHIIWCISPFLVEGCIEATDKCPPCQPSIQICTVCFIFSIVKELLFVVIICIRFLCCYKPISMEIIVELC